MFGDDLFDMNHPFNQRAWRNYSVIVIIKNGRN